LILEENSFISDATEIRSEKSGGYYKKTSIWYKPWTWGSEIWIETYKDKEVINPEKLFLEISNHLLGILDSTKIQAEKIASEQIIAVRDKFIKQMVAIDARLDSLLTDMETKTKSEKALNEAVKSNEVKREWLENFQHELDSLLTI
jgi:hypothetical protein